MYTVFDFMSHLAVKLDAPALAGFLEGQVRTAVLNAWGLLFSVHDWAYFHRTGSLVTKAAYTTGTISVNISTGVVTLTGGTFPADAAIRHIRIDHTWYPIQARTDGTTLQLVLADQPEEDQTDVAYVLQQIVYPLPPEVGSVVQMTSDQIRLSRIDLLDTYQILEGYSWSSTLPNRYALVGDSLNPGRWNLWIPTIQTLDQVLSYLYVARRPQNALIREEAGTVSVSAGVATFSDPIVSRLWNNAVVLRISEADSASMTGELGDVPGNVLLYNRAGDEVRVVRRLTDTTCEVSDASLTVTDRNYVASSMVDIAEGAMAVFMQRLCEREYGTRLVGGHSEYMVSQARLAEAFNTAREVDAPLARQGNAARNWYNMKLQYLGNARSDAYG